MERTFNRIRIIVELIMVIFLMVLGINLSIQKLYLEAGIIMLLALMYINRTRVYRLENKIDKLEKIIDDYFDD